MVAFLCLRYCYNIVYCVLCIWYCIVYCVLHVWYNIVYCVLCMWYSIVYLLCDNIVYCVLRICICVVYDMLWTGCDEWDACVTYYEFSIALLRPHITHHTSCTFTCWNDAVCPTSPMPFQVYCGVIHDTVPVLPWMWCGDGSCLCLGIMPYMAVWRMICMSYICHIFLSAVCHAIHFQPTHPPLDIQPVILI